MAAEQLGGGSDGADALLSELLPEELDWPRLVRRYPLPALVVSACLGYYLGRRSGDVILSAVADTAGRRVADVASGLFQE